MGMLNPIELILGLVAVLLLAALSIWIGAKHTYWAWTGQTEKLSIVVAGPDFIRESHSSRELLWKVGGPFSVLAGLAMLAYLLNFLVLCPLSERLANMPAVLC